MEGGDGARRAALYYGDPESSEPAKTGATRVLAEVILGDRSEGRMTGVAKVSALLDALDIGDPALAAIAGRVARKFVYDIDDRIADCVEIGVSLALSERSRSRLAALGEVDRGNAGWQHDLSVSQSKIGDVLVAQGNLQEAENAFRDGLAIAERLARADPGNAARQLELSVSQIRIGDVLVAQGNLPEALQAFLDMTAYFCDMVAAQETASDSRHW